VASMCCAGRERAGRVWGGVCTRRSSRAGGACVTTAHARSVSLRQRAGGGGGRAVRHGDGGKVPARAHTHLLEPVPQRLHAACVFVGGGEVVGWLATGGQAGNKPRALLPVMQASRTHAPAGLRPRTRVWMRRSFCMRGLSRVSTLRGRGERGCWVGTRGHLVLTQA